MKPNDVHVSVQLLSAGDHKHPLKLPSDSTLLELLQNGATALSVELLPNADTPLDLLHNVHKHGEIGPAIEPLSQILETFLAGEGNTSDFAIELVLAIKVNNRWKIAPEASMTPHQILDLFGLKYQEYSLYRENSTELLALETPILLKRGDVFEAQKDGKYGASR